MAFRRITPPDDQVTSFSLRSSSDMSSTCALRRSAPVIVLASAGESKHHAPMLRQSVAAVTLVVALFAVCACSEGGEDRESGPQACRYQRAAACVWI